jgi:hypothetical protein
MTAIFRDGLWPSFQVVAKGLFQKVGGAGFRPRQVPDCAGNLRGFPQPAKDELD